MKTTPRVQNMRSDNSGREIANQFEIFTDEGKYYQSYSTIVAFRDNNGNVTLDRNKWDYSRTTGKYRNRFLGETKKETERKIASGEYTLADLN
jgi:hypothetical protein